MATVAISGTAVPSMAPSDVVAGGQTIIATLTGDTFVPASVTATLQYVGSATATGNSASFNVSLTSLTGGIDTAARAGDLVIVATGFVGTSRGLTVGPTTAGYTEEANVYENDTRDSNFSVSWKIMGATPDTSVTCNGSTSSTMGAVAVAHVWRGVDQTTPMDVATQSSGATNSAIPTAPAITPVTTGAVVVIFGGATGASANNAPVAPSGFTDAAHISVDPGSSYTVVAAAQAWSGGTVTPGAWSGITSSTSDSNSRATLALRPATRTPFADAVPALISGLVSAQSESTGWNATVVPALSASNVVRTSDTVATITLPAVSSYAVTATETVTWTIPATALTGGVALTGSPTFTISPPPPISTLSEAFTELADGAPLPAAWTSTTQASGTVSVAGGAVHLGATSSFGSTALLTTAETYNALSSSTTFSVQFNAGGATAATADLLVGFRGPGQTYYINFTPGSVLQLPDGTVTSFNGTDPYFRIDIDATGRLTLFSSANGSTWTNLGTDSTAQPQAVSSAHFDVKVQNNSSAGNPSATFNLFNTAIARTLLRFVESTLSTSEAPLRTRLLHRPLGSRLVGLTETRLDTRALWRGLASSVALVSTHLRTRVLHRLLTRTEATTETTPRVRVLVRRAASTSGLHETALRTRLVQRLTEAQLALSDAGISATMGVQRAIVATIGLLDTLMHTRGLVRLPPVQSLGLTDTAQRVRTLYRLAASTLGPLETLRLTRVLVRRLLAPVTLTEQPARWRALVRPLVATVGVASSTLAARARAVFANASLAVSGMVAQARGVMQLVVERIGLVSAALSTRQLWRGALQLLGVTEAVFRMRAVMRTAHATLALSEHTFGARVLRRIAANLVAPHEIAALTLGMSRQVVESLGITSVQVFERGLAILVASVVGLSEQTRRVRALIRSALSSLGMLEHTFRARSLVRSAVSPLALTSTHLTPRALARRVADALGLVSAAAVTRAFVRSVVESVSVVGVAGLTHGFFVVSSTVLGIFERPLPTRALARAVSRVVGVGHGTLRALTRWRGSSSALGMVDNDSVARRLVRFGGGVVGVLEMLVPSRALARAVSALLPVLEAASGITTRFRALVALVTDTVSFTTTASFVWSNALTAVLTAYARLIGELRTTPTLHGELGAHATLDGEADTQATLDATLDVTRND